MTRSEHPCPLCGAGGKIVGEFTHCLNLVSCSMLARTIAWNRRAESAAPEAERTERDAFMAGWYARDPEESDVRCDNAFDDWMRARNTPQPASEV